jgi:hypothetical protein
MLVLHSAGEILGSFCFYAIVPAGGVMPNLVAMLVKEKKALQSRLESLEHAIAGLGGEAKRTVKRGKKMSAATRAKLSKAATARWAKIKKAAKV